MSAAAGGPVPEETPGMAAELEAALASARAAHELVEELERRLVLQERALRRAEDVQADLAALRATWVLGVVRRVRRVYRAVRRRPR